MLKNRIYRIINYALYVFFAIGVPIWLISEQYDLYRKVEEHTPQAMGIIVAIIVLFFFRGEFKKAMERMDEGVFKNVLREVSRVIPLLLLFYALKFSEIHMEKFQFIVLWSFVSNIIASTFEVNHLRLADKAKVIKNA